MVTLTRPKIDPDELYESVTSFSVGNDVFRPGFRVRGDHPAVVKHRALFVRADLDDLEKAAARREHQTAAHARAAAERPRQDPPPVAKPPAGPMRAVVSVTILDEALGGPRPLTAGTVVDASSAVYRSFPHLFVPEGR